MPLPSESALRQISEINNSPTLRNLSAQVHAKYILKETNESPARFPNFDRRLEDKALYLAYALLAAGCSIEETLGQGRGSDTLTRAASLLQEVFTYNSASPPDSKYQLLIAGMTFYSAGQYSRAFVTIKNASQGFLAGKTIRAFLQKDMSNLVMRINESLLAPERSDHAILSAMEAEDPSEHWLDKVATNLIARALSIHLEHLYSGDGSESAALAVLDDAMTCMSSDDAPHWWWIMRILKLMIRDSGANSTFNLLSPHFDKDKQEFIRRYSCALAFLSRPVFELWESQRVALALAVSKNANGGAISLRTSAGKTRIAEIAILRALLEHPQSKVFYIAPFRSLATEVENSLSATVSGLGFGVSQLYGGSVASRTDENIIAQSRVIIATPEKIKSLFRYAPHLKDDVGLIIIDEGHLIGFNARLIRNEMFIEGLLARARELNAKVLLLSAVLPNAEEIGLWIGGAADSSAKSPWKPSGERFGLLSWNGSRVRLEWQGEEPSFNPAFVEASKPFKPRRRKLFPSDKKEAIAATAVRLSTNGPVLIFSAMAVAIRGFAEAAMEAMLPNQVSHNWPALDWQIFEAACVESLGADSVELSAARLGIICHHAQLPTEVRFTIERLMRSFPPKIIVATTTLAQGVNIGVSSVIIANHYIDQQPMPHREFWNICGRAGRAFVDIEGKILFALDETIEQWRVDRDRQQALEYFDSSKVEHAISGLLGMLLRLREMAVAAGVDFDQLLEMAADNDFSALGTDSEYAAIYCDFIDDEILAALVNNPDVDPESLVETNFKATLAKIQSAHVDSALSAEELMAFLKARAKATSRLVSSEDRSAIVTSALPFRASISLLSMRGEIILLVSAFFSAENKFDALCTLVRGFEELAPRLTQEFAGEIPPLDELDQLRTPWLSGQPFAQIAAIHPKAQKIVNRHYGYALPWVMNGAAQQLKAAGEVLWSQELSLITATVELGLPSQTAVQVFLAGVMSRAAATEIANHFGEQLKGIIGRDLRLTLLNPEFQDSAKVVLSAHALRWLNLLTIQNASKSLPPPELPPLSIAAEKNLIFHVRTDTSGEIVLIDSAYKIKFSISHITGVDWPRAANDTRIVYRWSEPTQQWTPICRQPPFDVQGITY